MRKTYWLFAAALVAAPAGAADLVTYAEPDGTIRTAPVDSVRKDEESEFNARILQAGRRRTLKIPARRVIRFRRGDPDSVNQWSKGLARGKRLYESGQYATEGTIPGAEETFIKIAYSTEKGVKGEEKAYAISAWQNMYALFYLIETRYEMGVKGDQGKLQAALDNIAEFRQRSVKKTSIPWQVPGQKGTTKKAKVYCWGDTRLTSLVHLYEARILAAMKDTAKATAAYDALIDRAKRGEDPPTVLTAAMTEKAELEAAGQSSDKQETVFRASGITLSSLAKTQPDAYGKGVLKRAANQALLRGADLLLASAEQKSVGWDLPLQRYRELKSGEGKTDPALYIGAQTGIGVCLTEKGSGEEAYRALIEVIVGASEYPDQLARALYYIGKAAKLYADEVDSGGGKGDFLRTEAKRWWDDLRARYPSSSWAGKAQ